VIDEDLNATKDGEGDKNLNTLFYKMELKEKTEEK
jgi:hypothetical protein